MATEIKIKKGLDIPLEGSPAREIVDLSQASDVVLYPSEFPRAKPRLLVEEGSTVQRGTPLWFDKKQPGFQFRSPAAGTIRSIVFGERRSLQEIHIRSEGDACDDQTTYPVESIPRVGREEMLNHIAGSGLLGLIVERPFSRAARIDSTPKSIFINGMSNAPWRSDIHVVVQGREQAFQAGINALNCLTNGPVYLCLDADASQTSPAVNQAANVVTTNFSGPHPSGNTSTHIHFLDPVFPGDTVWTINACDLILIGEYLITGRMPKSRVLAIGGTGLTEGNRQYYRVPIGGSIAAVLGTRCARGENRFISGDVYAGNKVDANSSFRFRTNAMSVLREDRERQFLGWLNPGLNKFSTTRAYFSKWFGSNRAWDLGTSTNGSHRALVQTGLYDRYVPLDIMVDYMVRACISHDNDEAVRLGILGCDPEDFALCSVVCPSKTDFSAHIRRSLQEIEVEGL